MKKLSRAYLLIAAFASVGCVLLLFDRWKNLPREGPHDEGEDDREAPVQPHLDASNPADADGCAHESNVRGAGS